LKERRVNKRFLPEAKIPKDVFISYDLEEVINGAKIITLAIPSQHLRAVLRKLKKQDLKNKIILNVSKGIENSSLLTVSAIVKEELGSAKYAILSGPTIAHEVLNKIPTTAVVASRDKKVAQFVQDVFMTDRFRLYTNDDVIGVELGGSLKNIIAIACGISDGRGFGSNTKAAIISRGLAEITRLGLALGAKKETFSGISGIGDLITTCFSPYSRNRFVGEQIGKGKTLRQVLSSMEMIAEGVPTTKSAYRLSLKYNVDMPIIREIYSVLYRKKPVGLIADALMKRRKKSE
jgi:glycerol-3-phosphate dehydrogenase (NAD(P)+)